MKVMISQQRVKLFLLLFTLCAFTFSCSKDDDSPEASGADEVAGEYTGTYSLGSTETTNVKVVVEKAGGNKVIIRPQLSGATSFSAEITTTSAQGSALSFVKSETPGHTLTGSASGITQPSSKSIQYAAEVTINGQSTYEFFSGNK